MNSGLRITSLAAAVAVIALLVSIAPGSVQAAEPANGVGGAGCAEVKRARAEWYYNWYVDTDCDAPGFVPMVSGRDKQSPGDIKWQVDRAYNNGYRTLLGFNEPNQPGQSVMSVDKALDLWSIFDEHGDLRVGSPAVSGGNGGRQWMESFMAGAKERNLRVDFVAAHFYGWNKGSCTASSLRSYLSWIKSVAGGRPIWVTELGCLHESNTDAETVRRFYTDAVKVMRDMGVERWAWYVPEKNHALVANGELTPLGVEFAQNSPTGPRM